MNFSNKGINLHEILDILESNDNEQEATIYMIPPDDVGNVTDEDSDHSDDEHIGDIDHLGAQMLKTQCEVRVEEHYWDSEDDLPLSTFANKRTKLYEKVKWNIEPNRNVVINCDEIQPPAELNELSTPLQFFNLFFDQDVISNIVEQTNIYSGNKNACLNVTKDEIMTFLGALMLSGYGKYPNKRLYWSNQNDVPKILLESIRLNRFEAILRNLHLNDNAQNDFTDKLYKLRPLINTLNKNFKKYGGLEEKLSIDESMIPYYGKHYAKQYIKGKPIRFGFKNWALCTANGYMLAFSIYTGKTENRSQKLEFGLGGEVVRSLVALAGIPPNKGFKLYFDNYFTSIKLLCKLEEEGFCATGTIRENRIENCPIPDRKYWNKQNRGSFVFRQSEKIILCQWKDNKTVIGASNYENLDVGTTKRWCNIAKSKIAVPHPNLFSNYTSGMGGVDKMDSLVAVYRTRMRQKKWWWPIFSYLFDVSVVNSWLLMKKIHPTSPDCASLLKFRRYLANALLITYGKKSSKGKMPTKPIESTRFDGINHLINYSATDKRCVVCKKCAKFICEKCKVGLHPKCCFFEYHTVT